MRLPPQQARPRLPRQYVTLSLLFFLAVSKEASGKVVIGEVASLNGCGQICGKARPPFDDFRLAAAEAGLAEAGQQPPTPVDDISAEGEVRVSRRMGTPSCPSYRCESEKEPQSR